MDIKFCHQEAKPGLGFVDMLLLFLARLDELDSHPL